MGRWTSVAALLFFGFMGFAAAVSGTWNTSVVLGEAFNPLSTLTLNFGLAGDWGLTTVWTLEGSAPVGHEIVLEGSLGALGISAGAAFRISEEAALTQMGPASFSLDGLKFVGGYISFALSLGDFTFKLTLVEGTPPER